MQLIEDPAFSADANIRIQEAIAASSATYYYSRAGRFEDLGRWKRRLAHVAQTFPHITEIQNLAGKYLITYVEQAAKNWPYGRLDDAER